MEKKLIVVIVVKLVEMKLMGKEFVGMGLVVMGLEGLDMSSSKVLETG